MYCPKPVLFGTLGQLGAEGRPAIKHSQQVGGQHIAGWLNFGGFLACSARALFEELGFRNEALLKDHMKDSAGEYHDLLVMTVNVDEFLARKQALGVQQFSLKPRHQLQYHS